MKGLSNEKIMEAFLESDTQLKELFEGYDIKVMHQTLGSAIPEDEVRQCTHPELYFFGSGIKELMSKSDIVAFYPGWKVARGCNAEYNLAKSIQHTNTRFGINHMSRRHTNHRFQVESP